MIVGPLLFRALTLQQTLPSLLDYLATVFSLYCLRFRVAHHGGNAPAGNIVGNIVGLVAARMVPLFRIFNFMAPIIREEEFQEPDVVESVAQFIVTVSLSLSQIQQYVFNLYFSPP